MLFSLTTSNIPSMHSIWMFFFFKNTWFLHKAHGCPVSALPAFSALRSSRIRMKVSTEWCEWRRVFLCPTFKALCINTLDNKRVTVEWRWIFTITEVMSCTSYYYMQKVTVTVKIFFLWDFFKNSWPHISNLTKRVSMLMSLVSCAKNKATKKLNPTRWIQPDYISQETRFAEHRHKKSLYTKSACFLPATFSLRHFALLFGRIASYLTSTPTKTHTSSPKKISPTQFTWRDYN